MHHAFPAPRLQPLPETRRAPARVTGPRPAPANLAKPQVHIGLLDGHWSLESGHWSVHFVRQKFPRAAPKNDSVPEVGQQSEASPERQLLRSVALQSRIDYRWYDPAAAERPVV